MLLGGEHIVPPLTMSHFDLNFGITTEPGTTRNRCNGICLAGDSDNFWDSVNMYSSTLSEG